MLCYKIQLNNMIFPIQHCCDIGHPLLNVLLEYESGGNYWFECFCIYCLKSAYVITTAVYPSHTSNKLSYLRHL